MKWGIVLDSVKWILNGWIKQLGCSKISLACPHKWERPQKTANITMVLTAIAKPEHTHTTLLRIYTLSKSLYAKGGVSTPAALRESNLHFLKHKVSSSQRTQSERGWTGWERREGDQFGEGLKGMWGGDKEDRRRAEVRVEVKETERLEWPRKKRPALLSTSYCFRGVWQQLFHHLHTWFPLFGSLLSAAPPSMPLSCSPLAVLVFTLT